MRTRVVTTCAVAVGAASMVLVGCGASDPAGPHAAALQVAAALKVDVPVGAAAARDRLWVFGAYSGVLTAIDPTTNAVVQKVTPPHPPTTGVLADGSLWVVSYAHGVVMELDADTGQFVRTLDAPLHAPVGIAATGRDLWVVNHEDSTLTRIDARTGTVTGTTRLPGEAAGEPLVAGGSIWIGLAGDNTVVRVNRSTGQVDGEPLDLSPTGTCAAGSVIDHDVWFTSGRGEGFPCRDGARRIDARTSTVTAGVYGPGKHLHSFAGLDSGIWASDRGHTIYRVDVDTRALHTSLTLDRPDDDNRLITAFGSIWVLRPNTGRVLRVNAT